jgi:hypothetical protein
MGESNGQASGGRATDNQVMRESKRQSRNGEERETNTRLRRARDRQVMRKSKRHASEGEERQTGK